MRDIPFFLCLQDDFVLKFQFQKRSTLGKQLSIFRGENTNDFAFGPKSMHSLQFYVVHVLKKKFATRKGQSPMILHCSCRVVERTAAQNPSVVVEKKISQKTRVGCVLTEVFLFCLFGAERQCPRRPFLASSPLAIVKITVSENRKLPNGLPQPEKN